MFEIEKFDHEGQAAAPSHLDPCNQVGLESGYQVAMTKAMPSFKFCVMS